MVLRDLSVAIQRWLKRNPELSRTDFVAQALTEKLWRSGVDFPSRPKASRAQEHGKGELAKNKVTHDLLGSGQEVMIKGWLDEALVAEVDQLIRKVRPRLSRSVLFSEAAAEFLEAESIMSRKEALRHGAHQDLVRATLDIKRLLKKHAASRSTPATDLKNWPKYKQLKYVRRMLRELREIDIVLERTNLRVTEETKHISAPSITQ